jgi:hypothetical protein
MDMKLVAGTIRDLRAQSQQVAQVLAKVYQSSPAISTITIRSGTTWAW